MHNFMSHFLYFPNTSQDLVNLVIMDTKKTGFAIRKVQNRICIMKRKKPHY